MTASEDHSEVSGGPSLAPDTRSSDGDYANNTDKPPEQTPAIAPQRKRRSSTARGRKAAREGDSGELGGPGMDGEGDGGQEEDTRELMSSLLSSLGEMQRAVVRLSVASDGEEPIEKDSGSASTPLGGSSGTIKASIACRPTGLLFSAW